MMCVPSAITAPTLTLQSIALIGLGSPYMGMPSAIAIVFHSDPSYSLTGSTRLLNSLECSQWHAVCMHLQILVQQQPRELVLHLVVEPRPRQALAAVTAAAAAVAAAEVLVYCCQGVDLSM